MKKQPFCSFIIAGLALTDFGLDIPSPFSSLEISNSEIHSMTSWSLNCIVGGDSSKKVNIAAFEALLYSSAQEANKYANASGIPVSFMIGWLDEYGNVSELMTYQGFTLKFSVSTSGLYMIYTVTGYATLSVQSSMPVLRIPALSGVVQPSAVLVALAESTKATSYYQLDVDHNDAPTLIQHGPLTTSFNKYVRGEYTAKDDYDSFPGLLSLSKSYNASRDAAGISGARTLSQILNNVSPTSVNQYLKKSFTDTAPQCGSFSCWVDEPTMTRPGIIHYKSNAVLASSISPDVLEYGTSNTNIISLSGSYDGVAYNISDMKFSQVGFALDASGNEIIQSAEIVNSWSSSLGAVFQSANIINDVNAIATQFSGNFSVQIPGTTKTYNIAQPVSLLVLSGNTISPISGIYNITSVSHQISNTFITTLKLQRLVMSTANQVAASQNIYVSGSSNYNNTYNKTKNIISPYKVDFGIMYPTFEHMGLSM